MPPQPAKIVHQALLILSTADARLHFRIEGLNAHFKLQRPGRKLGDALAERRRQSVRNHLKMNEESGAPVGEKEVEDGAASGEVKLEGAVHKLELSHSAIEQFLEGFQQSFQGELTHG